MIKKKGILGIWDLGKSPLFLGGILTLIEELAILKIIHNINLADLAIVGNVDKQSLFSRVMSGFAGVDNVYFFRNKKELDKFLKWKPHIIWPEVRRDKSIYETYGNTLFVQRFYKDKGYIPFLSVRPEIISWVNNFYKNQVVDRHPVVVHLKYNPKCTKDCSNADFDAWYEFFKVCRQYKNIVFVLIGNDVVDRRIIKLSNVVVARDYGGNLIRDLGLIQMGYLFMGMASGPCNMAIFSKTPYIIYKDPPQHNAEMLMELGRKNRYSFANSYQQFWRIYHTRENLLRKFLRVYENRKIPK